MSQLRLGVDVGGTKIEGVALDGGHEVGKVRVSTPRGDYAATLDAIVSVVTTLDRRLGAQGTIGIGIPGTLTSAGLVKNANSVWLIGKPLRSDLEARLKRKVRVANDANCFAISEATDGAAAGADVVFGVIVGTGTGAGIVVGGQALAGANGIAGEWGHNPLPWPDADEAPGPACYCGKRGCIETFLSGPGMTADHQLHTGRREQPPGIVAAAATGDAGARATLARYERRLARGLASVINVLDPSVIVLGGGLSNIDRLYKNVPRLWAPYVFGAVRPGAAQSTRSLRSRPGSAERVRTRLVRARHGDSSGVRGAAWLWGVE